MLIVGAHILQFLNQVDPIPHHQFDHITRRARRHSFFATSFYQPAVISPHKAPNPKLSWITDRSSFAVASGEVDQQIRLPI